jgi:hypothetical protein
MKKQNKKYAIIFLLGFFSCALFIYGFYLLSNFKTITGFAILSEEIKNSPPEKIPIEKIKINSEEVILKIPNARITKYANTQSMIPTIGENSKGIQIVPSSEEEIKIGTIISFKEEETITVHRVIEIGKDEYGTYYITKGDNSPVKDKRIRFSEIKYITIGVIW